MEFFYVAVTKNGRPEGSKGNVALVAGPFATQDEANQHYEAACRYVRNNYWREGSDWWGYAIVGLQDYDQPGKLNEELGIKSVQSDFFDLVTT